MSLTVPRSLESLVKRKEKDPFTSFKSFNWFAMGDSYTAGPGAGNFDRSNDGKCARHEGSYARQMENDWLYEGSHFLNFIACSGAVSQDVLDLQVPAMGPKHSKPDLVMMTVGGNDIGFGNIAKACLVGLIWVGSCDNVIAE